MTDRPARVATRAALDELLATLTNYERLPAFHAGRVRVDLHRMQEYVARLGHPERASPAVHVTGTKGKGSTAMLLAQLLGAAGERVGLHTSPHLDQLEDRVVVDGAAIAEADLLAAANEIVAARDAGGDPGFPTFFEFVTLVAFLHFRRRGVGVAVHEVGMGGALDATNVLAPAAVALTNVAIEHAAVLGATREAIAREKCGIVKPGAPLVTGVARGDPVDAVIAAAARAAGVPVRRLGEDIVVERVARRAERGITVTVRTWRERRQDLRLPLLGEHQAANLALALGLLDVLQDAGLAEVADDALRAALAAARLPGRFESFGGDPLVIVDGAHTAESLERMVGEARAIRPGVRLVAVLGVAGDKDLPRCARAVAAADRVVTTPYDSPRAADPQQLAELVRAAGGAAEAAGSPRIALERARDLAERGGAVLVLGSLYLAGEVRALLAAPRREGPPPEVASWST